MNHGLLDSLMRIALNAPKPAEFDPRDYTAEYVKQHDRCDDNISPRKREKIVYEEDIDDDDDEYDFEANVLGKKYKLGQSSLF